MCFFSLPVISGTCFLLEQERCFSFKRKPLPLLIGMLLLFEWEHSFCSCGNVFFSGKFPCFSLCSYFVILSENKFLST